MVNIPGLRTNICYYIISILTILGYLFQLFLIVTHVIFLDIALTCLEKIGIHNPVLGRFIKVL